MSGWRYHPSVNAAELGQAAPAAFTLFLESHDEPGVWLTREDHHGRVDKRFIVQCVLSWMARVTNHTNWLPFMLIIQSAFQVMVDRSHYKPVIQCHIPHHHHPTSLISFFHSHTIVNISTKRCLQGHKVSTFIDTKVPTIPSIQGVVRQVLRMAVCQCSSVMQQLENLVLFTVQCILCHTLHVKGTSCLKVCLICYCIRHLDSKRKQIHTIVSVITLLPTYLGRSNVSTWSYFATGRFLNQAHAFTIMFISLHKQQMHHHFCLTFNLQIPTVYVCFSCLSIAVWWGRLRPLLCVSLTLDDAGLNYHELVKPVMKYYNIMENIYI